MSDERLVFKPIHELAPLLASKQLSPRELTAALLAHIATHEPKLHAFADQWRDGAVSTAAAQEGEIQVGAYRGPLHGIPMGFKDMIEVAGRRTTGGAGIWKDRRSQVTATAYERLVNAGVNVFGKLNLVEFSCIGWGINQAMGTPWNPWDLASQRVPGGSSSGSGVAVASGMLPAAIGSDTGGSIRVPAALNGTVGLKPTYGRVSNFGIIHISPSLDSVGPLTRSVEDAAIVLSAMAGPGTDPRDQNSPSVVFKDAGLLRKPITGMRIGLLARDQLGDVDLEIWDAVQAAARTLEQAGARVTETRAPRNLPDYAVSMATIFLGEGYLYLKDTIDAGNFSPDEVIRERLLTGKAITTDALIMAGKQQALDRAEARGWLADFDVILSPTSPIIAPTVAECDTRNSAISSLTRWVNYLGLCGLAVPCGFSRGMPISLQIVASAFQEAKALQVGWAYEQATDWHKRHPAL